MTVISHAENQFIKITLNLLDIQKRKIIKISKKRRKETRERRVFIKKDYSIGAIV